MHPLTQRLSRFRRRVRRWLALDALARLATVVLVAVIALGGADYRVHFADPGLHRNNPRRAAPGCAAP